MCYRIHVRHTILYNTKKVIILTISSYFLHKSRFKIKYLVVYIFLTSNINYFSNDSVLHKIRNHNILPVNGVHIHLFFLPFFFF